MKRQMMAMLAAAGLLLAGCLESNDAYVLNPDGSGKVVRIVIFQPKPNLGGMTPAGGATAAESKKKSAAEALEAARAELEQSEGVDTWKDVKAYWTKDERICFLGTAYFQDLAKVKFHNGGLSGIFNPAWTKDATGTLVLAMTQDKQSGAAAATANKPAPKMLTAAEITEKVAAERTKYQEAKPMMNLALSSLKMYASFRLPGKVAASTNFKTDKAGNLCIMMQGTKMLAAMDAMIMDDQAMAEQARVGAGFSESGPSMDNAMNEKLFGQKGPVRAIVAGAGAAPLFNYATEVAAAKAAYPAIQKKFGVNSSNGKSGIKMSGNLSGGEMTFTASGSGGGFGGNAAPEVVPPTGGALINVKADMRGFTRAAKAKSGSGNYPGATLTADFPSAVTSVDGGRLEKAVADNGEELLPGDEFFQKINFPRLADNKVSVAFYATVNQPSVAVKSCKELAGYLTYSVAKGTKTVDLGIKELTAGSKGTQYQAAIDKIGPSKFNASSQEIALTLALPHSAVKTIQVCDAAGKSLEAKQTGYSGFGTQTTFTLTLKDTPPKNGSIKVEVYDGIQKFKAPFVVRDVAMPL